MWIPMMYCMIICLQRQRYFTRYIISPQSTGHYCENEPRDALYYHGLTMIKTSKYIHDLIWDKIPHPSLNCNSGLNKQPPLNLGYGWIVTFYCFKGVITYRFPKSWCWFSWNRLVTSPMQLSLYLWSLIWKIKDLVASWWLCDVNISGQILKGVFNFLNETCCPRVQ